jgi:hypothetical protein
MGSPPPSFSSEIEKLVQRSVSPETPLTETEREFLDASYAILELNYVDIDEFLEDDPFQNPIIRSETDDEILFHMKFDEHGFTASDLGSMSDYLHHTRQPEREYPFSFISGFPETSSSISTTTPSTGSNVVHDSSAP